jgi:hypothetical protein
MKTRVVASHITSRRDTWWYVIQEDDGTLHVGQDSDWVGGEQVERTIPINGFLREGGGPQGELQKLIDKMFEHGE